MSGAVGALSQLAASPVRGILDFRQQLINQRNDLLNPLVQQLQQEQAQQAQDLTRYQLGDTGQGVQLQEGGLYTDLGPARGLLADERFADNKAELVFGANLMGNQATQQLGQAVIGNVISQQQQVDLARPQAEQDLLTAALNRQRQAEQDALARQQQGFSQAQALEQDYAGATPITAANQVVGLYNNISDTVTAQNPLATVGNIVQLARLFDPNARQTTEGDVQVIRGSFPLSEQLNNSLRRLQGGGWDADSARNVLAIAQQLTRSTLESAQPTYNRFIERANANPLVDPADVVGRYGLDQILGVEGGIDSLLGPSIDTIPPPPPGTRPGRRPDAPGVNSGTRRRNRRNSGG